MSMEPQVRKEALPKQCLLVVQGVSAEQPAPKQLARCARGPHCIGAAAMHAVPAAADGSGQERGRPVVLRRGTPGSRWPGRRASRAWRSRARSCGSDVRAHHLPLRHLNFWLSET